jgi:hypothetical protein
MATGRRRNYLWEAFELAKKHQGARIVTVAEKIDRTQPYRDGNLKRAYVVYYLGQRHGRREDPRELLKLLEKVLGLAPRAAR